MGRGDATLPTCPQKFLFRWGISKGVMTRRESNIQPYPIDIFRGYTTDLFQLNMSTFSTHALI